MGKETWIAIPGYEGLYEVSNQHRVRRLARTTTHGQHNVGRKLQEKLLKLSRNNGYLVAYLGGNGASGSNARKLYVEAAVEHLFGIKPTVLNEMVLPDEEWKDIPGYEGIYQASTLGRVRSIGRYVGEFGSSHINVGAKRRYIRPKLLPGGVGTSGYRKLELAARGVIKTISVHRLVAMTFIPNPLGLPIVHHKDEDKLNNRLDNLEWATAATNVGNWFSRRRIVITPEVITDIGKAIASGKSAHEIFSALPRQRKPHKSTR